MLSFHVEINTQDKAYNLKKAPFTNKEVTKVVMMKIRCRKINK